MKSNNYSSYIALFILLAIVVFGTISSLITAPMYTISRLILVAIFIYGAREFVKFADSYADKHAEKK